MDAIVAQIMNHAEETWDDLVFYSQVFLTLTKTQQKAWVDGMEKRWKDTLPSNDLFAIGKAYLAFLHYQNLFSQNESSTQ